MKLCQEKSIISKCIEMGKRRMNNDIIKEKILSVVKGYPVKGVTLFMISGIRVQLEEILGVEV